ncbi:Xaa-Pro dipeptidase [Marinobacterium jannaschii]|uniref:Xaa-Pro dipeptidase n=1 Tax=Marinobacterium jannaschii TaxID=64970 RepID=UPI0004820E7B|nr:Xaa-Pro dipeptidase [Marinobacterium jannaschii]
MDQRFIRHIEQLQNSSEQHCSEYGFDGLLIGSGAIRHRFRDDTHYPFRANPQFLQWLPFLGEHPDCWLLVRTGRKPLLLYHFPQDFWHMTPELPSDWWTDSFEILPYSQPAELQAALPASLRLAVLSEQSLTEMAPQWQLNPAELLAALDYQRAVKSEWEQHCLRQANRIAVTGHRAAEQAFLSGQSEYQIHQSYLNAIDHNERDMPYDNIVALNEHAAVLHYQFQQRQAPESVRSLLIDAGASYLGYAADITRTFANKESHDGGLFAELITGLDKAQCRLMDQVRAGVDFVELHQAMHRMIAALLNDSGLVSADIDRQLAQGITRTFFPHGLGHFLGLQVHDVGGWQQDAAGNQRQPPVEHPFLRLTRTLQAGQVITVEPGLYFIPMLLQQLRNSEASETVNWALVERLQPFGGIRIEDNVLIMAEGNENFTRDAFTQ